jgi:hypothetical protein
MPGPVALGMSVGVEVGAICAERLKRDGIAGADMGSVQQRLEGLGDRSSRRLRERAEQFAVAPDKPTQDEQGRKRPVGVRRGSEYLPGELFSNS